MTELRRLRLSYGVSTKELCAELNMATGLYSVHENGSRKYKGERYEQFYFDVAQALNRIVKRNKELSLQAATYQNEGLTLADSKLHQLMASEDEEEDDLIFPPITEEIFRNVLQMLQQGFNTIQIAVRLGICENELKNRIGSVKSSFNVEKIVES